MFFARPVLMRLQRIGGGERRLVWYGAFGDLSMSHCALIVDDDEHTLYFIEQVLRPLRLEILKAANGEQALAYLQQSTPAILFLDLLLPRISGLDVLNYVSSAPHLKMMYVVVVSAHDPYHFNVPMPRADVYLVKPVRPKEILTAAEFAISQQPV
jgi:two-component system alkaline phosphatase synthesis response regulator PhoP